MGSIIIGTTVSRYWQIFLSLASEFRKREEIVAAAGTMREDMERVVALYLKG
ncbi:MAG: hypothetical protein JSW32_00680 [Deltaproteobacteria bacterium]|nr:MAG: hypothetical protein JSW32_00680 [Deltaproteobacteria bacterium]